MPIGVGRRRKTAEQPLIGTAFGDADRKRSSRICLRTHGMVMPIYMHDSVQMDLGGAIGSRILKQKRVIACKDMQEAD